MHSDVEDASVHIDHFAQHLRFSVGSRRSVHRDVSARFEHAGFTTLYAAPRRRRFALGTELISPACLNLSRKRPGNSKGPFAPFVDVCLLHAFPVEQISIGR